MMGLNKRLKRFAKYEKGWDGQDAYPISQKALMIADDIINNRMSIFALPCGGLELTSDNFSITINRDGEILIPVEVIKFTLEGDLQ